MCGDAARKKHMCTRVMGHAAADVKAWVGAAQVKVFWTAMCKWYAGKVSAFDAATGKHTVMYKDGDVQHLVLANEAVVWPGVPGLDAAAMMAAFEASCTQVRPPAGLLA